jgi:hypothetical protein
MGKDEGSVLGKEGARIGVGVNTLQELIIFAKDSASFVLMSQGPLPSHYFVIEMGVLALNKLKGRQETSELWNPKLLGGQKWPFDLAGHWL